VTRPSLGHIDSCQDRLGERLGGVHFHRALGQLFERDPARERALASGIFNSGAVCGASPTVTEPVDYEAFCQIRGAEPDDAGESEPARSDEAIRFRNREETHDGPTGAEEAVEVRDLGEARVEREGQGDGGDVPAQRELVDSGRFRVQQQSIRISTWIPILK